MKKLCNCQLWEIEFLLSQQIKYGQNIKAMQLNGWDKKKLEDLYDLLVFRALKKIRNINKRPCVCNSFMQPTRSDYDYMLSELEKQDFKDMLDAIDYS